MKNNKLFVFNKKPLNRKNLLLDEEILKEKNEFEDIDNEELAEYLFERYGITPNVVSLLYGYSNPKKIKKENKKEYKKNSKKQKKNKSYEWDDDYVDYNKYDDIGMCDKIIYYYRDINQPEDVEEFNNLHSFDEFIREEGIEISDTEANNLMSREISHCCINPKDRYNKNKLTIMTSSSYGDLRFSNAELEYEMYDY